MQPLQTDKQSRFLCHAALWLSFGAANMLIVVGAWHSIAFAQSAFVSESAESSSTVSTGNAALTARAAEPAAWNRIRFDNPRIAEVFRFAVKKSTAFQDLVATLELADRMVYIEEGSCRHQLVQGCLQLMATPGGKHLLVRIASRELINRVAAQLAHELYHAAEIGREPSAIDEASIRALYHRIGERSCATNSDDCWETRAAVAFETLVIKELNGVNPMWPWRRHPGPRD